MSKITITVKVFDRVAFDKVKVLQNRKKPAKLEEIMQRTGFGKETVRKAMKAPNWPQYRKNETSRQKQRQLVREEKKQFDDIWPNGTQHADGPFLPMKNEGKISKGFVPPEIRLERFMKHRREIITWGLAILVFSLVLFLILK